MGRVFFIADTHFGHENIIRLCNRPFQDVNMMNECMFNGWNSRVAVDDDIYIVGDVIFKSTIELVTLLSRLNGRKHLAIGNHDKKSLKDLNFRKCFVEIGDILTLNMNKTRIIICHYPICEWEGYFRGSYLVYGHIHNTTTNRAYKVMAGENRALNAGADIIHYVPATFEELISYNNQFKSINPV